MTRITLDDGRELVAEITPATLTRAIGSAGGKVAVQEHGTMRWTWLRISSILEIDRIPVGTASPLR